MRLFLWSVLLSAGVAAARADTPGPAEPPLLLQEAIEKYARDAERWAYTLTDVRHDKKGGTKEISVVRFDPSRHYDEQWTLLRKDGEPATARQVRKYRHDMDERRRNRKTLGELVEWGKATVIEETPAFVTYEAPLAKVDNQRLPPEKFRVTMRVGRERRELENIAVRLRSSLRAALIVKLSRGAADIQFHPVNPQFPAPITAIKADGAGSVFFVKFNASYEQTRTDFKRVKPYDERFEVKIGPLKALDF